MCTRVFIIILSASYCFCYAGYELFQGFYAPDVNNTSDSEAQTVLNSIPNEKSATSVVPFQILQTTTILMHPQTKTSTNTTESTTLTTESKVNGSREIISTSNKDSIETISMRPTKFDCPEDEKPSNIGPYEIPTQRDMVLYTRTMLLDMFNTYNKEAFFLLRDIRAATKATSSIEKKCKGNKLAYKQCVKRASRQCEEITKNLVKGIENQKQEILNITKRWTQHHTILSIFFVHGCGVNYVPALAPFTIIWELKVKICNLSEMTIDPIEMLKSLAQEKVSLQFALPGFLRLLSTCSLMCIKSEMASNYDRTKPSSHLTYQDLVIKHFLTRKNYLWNS